jgi:hypothetical protein
VQGVQGLLKEMWQHSVEEEKADGVQAQRPSLGGGLSLTDADVRLLRNDPGLLRRSSTTSRKREAAQAGGGRLSVTMPAPVRRSGFAATDSVPAQSGSAAALELPRPASFAVVGEGLHGADTPCARGAHAAPQRLDQGNGAVDHTGKQDIGAADDVGAARSAQTSQARDSKATASQATTVETDGTAMPGSTSDALQQPPRLLQPALREAVASQDDEASQVAEASSHDEHTCAEEGVTPTVEEGVRVEVLEEAPQDAAEMALMYDAMTRQMQEMQARPRRRCSAVVPPCGSGSASSLVLVVVGVQWTLRMRS